MNIKAIAVKLVGLVTGSFPIFTWFAKTYVKSFKALTRGTYSAVSVIRALMIQLAVTLALVYGVLFTVIPGTYHFVKDAVTIEAFSYSTEPMFLGKPEWISDYGNGDEVLSVSGCDTLPCTEDNSREYRFRDSLYLDVVYWLTRFEPYDHSDIAAIAQSERNYCSIDKGYGSRNKILGWYPYIFSLTCYDLPVGTGAYLEDTK
jgi:hypothetical protein